MLNTETVFEDCLKVQEWYTAFVDKLKEYQVQKMVS